jgi:subtilisin
MSTSSLEETVSAIGYAKVIVALNAAPAAAAAAAVSESAIAGHFMVPDAAQAESLAVSASLSASRKFRRAEPSTERRVRVYQHLGLAIGYVNANGLAALEADPQVGKVEKAPELSLIRPKVVLPAKLGTGPTWGIKRLKADRLWASGFTGKGVLVGHLDTGVDGTHPALKGAIGKFAEFDMAGDQVPNAPPTDSDEHGTHTAGTIVGRAGLKGAFGMAPEAQLASAMVIEGGQVVDRILAGMDWLIGEGVHIMSMSLGLRGFTPAFQAVIDALRAANVLPVIAVGNEGPNTSRSPGNYANVLSIGAMNTGNRVADFSGSQRFNRPINPLCPALVAPGVGVLSCVPGNKYKTMDGSSMGDTTRRWSGRPAVAGETDRDGQRPRACHRWLVHPPCGHARGPRQSRCTRCGPRLRNPDWNAASGRCGRRANPESCQAECPGEDAGAEEGRSRSQQGRPTAQGRRFQGEKGSSLEAKARLRAA